VDRPVRYATTVDGYERVTLQDGSLLELNASSEARVRFTKDERRVELRRGEAHFTVAKNPARPFWVEAGTVSVRAVGTAFNVRLGAKVVEVLVTEGRVAVATTEDGRRRTDGGNAIQASVLGPPSSELTVGERLVVPGAGSNAPPVEKLDSVAIREALAWQGPRLTFLDTPLSVVVSQFNRRNQAQLVIRDAELEALPIGGSFRAENLEGFVRLLEQDNDIVVDRSEPSRIVLRKKK
jgi:transmembrane sensor